MSTNFTRCRRYQSLNRSSVQTAPWKPSRLPKRRHHVSMIETEEPWKKARSPKPNKRDIACPHYHKSVTHWTMMDMILLARNNDYHVTHFCVRKPIQNARYQLSTAFHPNSNQASQG